MPDWRLHPLRNYSSVKRWLNEKTELTDNYKYLCLSAISEYSTFRHLNPDQLITEFVEASRLDPPARLKPKDMLTTWRATLTNDGTIRQFHVANLLRRILPFFESNGCHIGLIVTNPKSPARETTTRATQPITRQFVDASPDPQFQWAIMDMAESGMRPGSVCQLQFKHLQRSYQAVEEPLAIEIPGKITKTGQSYFAFVLGDARNILTQVLEQHRSSLTPESRIINISASRLEHYVAELGIKLKINPPSGLKPFTCGSWRENCQNRFEDVDIPQNRVSLLMGRRPLGVDAHYVNPPVEVLAAAYMKAADKLRIYG